MTHASVQVDGLVRSHVLRRGLPSAELITHWPEIVGAYLGLNTIPVKISFGYVKEPGANKSVSRREGGRVMLHVANSGVAVAVNHTSTLIVEKVNSFFGYRAVESIGIARTGPIPRTPVKQHKPLPPLNAADRAVLDKTLATLSDPDLAASLAALGEAVLGRLRQPRVEVPPDPRPLPSPARDLTPRRPFIPEVLEPPRSKLVLLFRFDARSVEAVAAADWWEAQRQIIKFIGRGPSWWWYDAKALTADQRTSFPAAAQKILHAHGSVVEISRRDGKFEYLPPVKGTPTVHQAVWDWVHNEGVNVIFFASQESLRTYLADKRRPRATIEKLREAASLFGWDITPAELPAPEADDDGAPLDIYEPDEDEIDLYLDEA